MQKIINHIIDELKIAQEWSKNIKDDIYLELSKDEIINYFEKLYCNISKWNLYYRNKEIDKIISNYKQYESIISELELCLLDYDDIISITDISLSYYELGKKLTELSGEK